MEKQAPYNIRIAWLYPDLMSIYGDRGNITVLETRLIRRNIRVSVIRVGLETDIKNISECDIVLGGGAQDRQQEIVIEDLRKNKASVLREMFAGGKPGLFVCGSPQLLGYSYMTGDGKVLKGLGIFDMETKHFGHTKPRLIGNFIGIVKDSFRIPGIPFKNTIVGFENHGGRTYLGKGVQSFAHVVYGWGNNGEDKTEGALYKNCIATYSHGPFLPKNPHIADWLIMKALRVKYGHDAPKLSALDDSLEWRAHEFMLARYSKVTDSLLP